MLKYVAMYTRTINLKNAKEVNIQMLEYLFYRDIPKKKKKKRRGWWNMEFHVQ